MILTGSALFLWLIVIPARSAWKIEVDTRSGRVRSTRYVFLVPISRSVRDSSISLELGEPDAGRDADWHPVVSGSPGSRFSPHYRYHGALNQVRELEMIWGTARFTAEARRRTAREMLRLWRRDGDDYEAGHYLQTLWERTSDRKGGMIGLADLPR